jgi:hypothetical protein
LFDLRKLGLGRWLCSTRQIFENGFYSLRGFLGAPSKIKSYEIKPYRLYRLRSGEKLEVEIVMDLPHFEPYQQSLLDIDLDPEDKLRDADDDGTLSPGFSHENYLHFPEFFGKERR